MFTLHIDGSLASESPSHGSRRSWKGELSTKGATGRWWLRESGPSGGPPLHVIERGGELTLSLGWPLRLADTAVGDAPDSLLTAAAGDARRLGELGGRFALVAISPTAIRLTSDVAATIPLYVSTRDGHTIVTDDLRSVAESEPMTIDRAAFVDLLLLHHPLRGRTVWRGWSKVRPRSCLTLRPSGESQEEASPPLGPVPSREMSTRGVEADRAIAECITRLEDYVRFLLRRPAVIALTGGVDSRTLAAIAHASSPDRVATITHGITDCGDRAVARDVSERLGFRHIPIVSEEIFPYRFDELFARLIERSDGQSSAMWAHVPLANDVIRSEGNVVINGVGGECARAFYTHTALRTSEPPEEMILRKSSGPVAWRAVARLMDTDEATLLDDMRSRIGEALETTVPGGGSGRPVELPDGGPPGSVLSVRTARQHDGALPSVVGSSRARDSGSVSLSAVSRSRSPPRSRAPTPRTSP